MFLKVGTTASVATGIILVLLWPLLVGPKPTPDGTAMLAELRDYAQRVVAYISVTMAVWLIAAGFAVFLARHMRRQYREEAMQNLQELIEGALADHEHKRS